MSDSSSSETSDYVKQTVQNLLNEQNIEVDDATSKRKRFAPKTSTRDLELAVTVILVDLASSDQSFDPSEYNIIVHGLMRLFGTPKHEVSALVNQAQTVLRNMRGVAKYGNLLKEHMSIDDRVAVMEVIEDVIMADGEVDDYEVYLRHKLRGMLGIQAKHMRKKREG